MIALGFLACADPALTSADREERVAAVDALSGAEARELVPRLEKWAALSTDGRADLSDAALRALLRADTDAAFAIVEARVHAAGDPAALRALKIEPLTRRACEAVLRARGYDDDALLRRAEAEPCSSR